MRSTTSNVFNPDEEARKLKGNQQVVFGCQCIALSSPQAYLHGGRSALVTEYGNIFTESITTPLRLAWSVLVQCYENMEQGQKALQLRIMAAHLRHDADDHEWDQLASLDPTNVDALWDRASLAKEVGDFRTARNAFIAILKRFPHNLTVLRELHTILGELTELPTCANLLQAAFKHYQPNLTCSS
ncbi:uncharacterized protein LACBIDRAFT_329308 [Laccaria bicolor S238N-H82]|uniref:Predicted protein n=1 Tax=Laccaria bicolor (strain S238N-H82 / ATCC MYA-4686) TaxID=486041 RepID=B0DHM4_LACBS|nr:uncharacterized protein LACBIDRAFT_329308 [Laccaria bicolor S238N-H82]EDR05755.1 predicted protein [Laccaria bicolor S238N-H82]|eukprot:XP_001883431.1 predicted protein [Laccaria bicolor S238N-H82]